MKTTIIIILTVLLALSIIVNIAAYYAIRADYDVDKEELRRKTSMMYWISSDHHFHQLSDTLITNFDIEGSQLDSLNDLVRRTQNRIVDIENRLIETSGGFNVNGEFVNPRSKIRVSKYFFSSNNVKTEGQRRIDELISDYLEGYHRLTTGKDSHIEDLYRIYQFDKNESFAIVFQHLTLSESLSVLRELRTRVELDRYKFITHSR